MTLDVLNHNNRVVDDSTNCDGQRTEGQDVERVAKCLQADKGDEHRRRDGNRRHKSGSHRQQEDKNRDDREEQTQQALLSQRIN